MKEESQLFINLKSWFISFEFNVFKIIIKGTTLRILHRFTTITIATQLTAVNIGHLIKNPEDGNIAKFLKVTFLRFSSSFHCFCGRKTQFIITAPSHLRPHLLPPLSLYFLTPPPPPSQPFHPSSPLPLPIPSHILSSPPSPYSPPYHLVSTFPYSLLANKGGKRAFTH